LDDVLPTNIPVKNRCRICVHNLVQSTLINLAESILAHLEGFEDTFHCF
jgi:hypothetical protein